jgi:ferredoxin
MLGREAPLEFFRRSGLEVRGDWRPPKAISLAVIFLVCIFIYHWKKGGVYLGVSELFERNRWFPFNIPDWWAALGPAFANRANILGTLRITIGEPGFYYSLAYTLCVTLFGLRRIRRKKTPYITAQTLTLIAIQVVPLFLVPYIFLPWAGNNGWFDSGIGKTMADALFPVANYGHGREYWRAFGLVLAWPLFFWNVFTDQPMWTWLVISFLQTFVIIPLIIFRWGKGAYCGWICSCGALAETLGDAHRTKMPHGPGWNRFNMLGQVFLAMAFFLLLTRSLAWAMPGSFFGSAFQYVFKQMPVFNYVWFVDLLWAGIIGVGFYWHFSGRVWCRFACPLAALMHIYTRFSRFRIFPEKSKCISCNVCTSVCHQGIDIMNFANKGLPMKDPQCVRCSACVQECPTGVLSFGHYDGGRRIVLDKLPASPVRMREGASR